MIEIYDEVLSIDLIQEIKEYVRSQTGHRSNYTSWGLNIINSSTPVLIFDIDGIIKDQIIAQLKDKINIVDWSKASLMYYYWTKFSYIPWHNDENKKHGITIYMNEYWDKNWGGYFAYDNGNKIECIKPEYNKAVKINAPLKHTVFSTNIDAPVRETIQIFVE
jgi:Rps23 Pro-64 3,4-dihydroxylase Tpa1-like proline 4-hydroxylase